MTEFDNTNRGSIWKNEKKEKETQADFTGTINVEGVEYWLNGWRRKEGASPKSPAMTFSVRRKEGERAAAPARKPARIAQKASVSEDLDDIIPF